MSCLISREEELQASLEACDVLWTNSCVEPFGAAAPREATIVDLGGLTGIVDFSPDDQVVVVRAGTTLGALNAELAAHGQCIPHHFPVDLGDPMLHQLLGAALPHSWEETCGTWRAWVLGMSVMDGRGTMAKCGSRAVKNVAGYDVQRLMLGSRGTLGIITQVILRTYPVRALPMRPDTVPMPPSLWVQRVLRSDFDKAVGNGAIASDPETGTLWLDHEPVSFANSWSIGPGGEIRQQATPMDLMVRTKATFDPAGRLNPGALGARL